MKEIRHLGIVVSDLDRALEFYVGLLGLKVCKRMEEGGEYLVRLTGLTRARATTVKLSADDRNLVELVFFHSHPRKSPAKKDMSEIGASHVSFTVEDVEAEYNRLRRVGIEFVSPPQNSPDGYAKVAFCRDFDNTLIELVQLLERTDAKQSDKG